MTTICLAVLSSALLGCVIWMIYQGQKTQDSERTQYLARDTARGLEQQRLIETLCSSFFGTTPRSTPDVSTPDADPLAWEAWSPDQMLEEQDRYAMGPWQTNGQARQRIEEGLNQPPTEQPNLDL